MLTRPSRELKALPSSQHWFCPRTSDEDGSVYFDEDSLDPNAPETEAQKEARHAKVEEARQLKKKVLQACQIFAFDGETALQLGSVFKSLLKFQLQRCTICVREYHRGRQDVKHDLEAQYDADLVASFMHVFDQMNTERIAAGLDPPRSRSPRTLDRQSASGRHVRPLRVDALHSIPTKRIASSRSLRPTLPSRSNEEENHPARIHTSVDFFSVQSKEGKTCLGS
jgi:hypothetical protein